MFNQLMTLAAACCAGVAVGCLFLAVMEFLAGVRIERNRELPKRMPILFRLLVPLVPLVRGIAAGKSLLAWRQYDAPRLWMAGFGEVFTPVDFAGLRLLHIAVGFGVLVLGVLSGRWLFCLVLGGLIAAFPGLWLSSTIRQRHLAIMKALPNVLDLLTLSVESGRDIMSALRDILAKRRLDDLGEELMLTFQEIQLGRKRGEALRALAQRVRQPDLTATVNAIIQAEELGVSIAHLLRIQGDMQRAKRYALAEKLAGEAPVKIIIPVVLFIVPAVFLILLLPVILQTLRMFR